MKFGFSYLLLFVFATIPTGVISKTQFSSSLADVDWLHGGAELLLTVSNVLLVLGLRRAIMEGPQDPSAEVDEDAPSPALFLGVPESTFTTGAFGILGTVTLFLVLGLNVFNFEGHDAFLAGIGNLPSDLVSSVGLPEEPVNALVSSSHTPFPSLSPQRSLFQFFFFQLASVCSISFHYIRDRLSRPPPVHPDVGGSLLVSGRVHLRHGPRVAVRRGHG